ncbi:hypothetical protein LXA43DRAFT_712453 [Ganoderma leucocontextum]|nr:hypothetical protein LXA43DRAFT_712453 [Ganoderma leucocontextum]
MATMNSLAGFQDIFYHVISHLAADLEASDASYHESTDAKSVRRTLARLARVHSGLSRPALAALWRRLWDDRPLRHLLWVVGIARRTSSKHQWDIPPLEIRGKPATSYESIWEQVQECASLVRRIIFGTETWQSSWKRFQAYASLVREIILDPFVGIVDTPLQSKIWQDNFWRRLSSGLGNLPILPRLEAASLLTPNSFKHRSFDAGTLCLLNPSIRELNIIFPQAGAQDEFKVKRPFRTASRRPRIWRCFPLRYPFLY